MTGNDEQDLHQALGRAMRERDALARRLDRALEELAARQRMGRELAVRLAEFELGLAGAREPILAEAAAL